MVIKNHKIYRIVVASVLMYVSCAQGYKISVDLSPLALTKQQKYFSGGSLRDITLFVPQSSESNRRIGRCGVLIKRPNARATIIMCHGYKCDKFDSAPLRLLFSEYNIVSFDFRGHGDVVDMYQCCTLGYDEAHDVIAAASFVRTDPDLKHLPLICYGFSMGAVAAIVAQASGANYFKDMYGCPLFDGMILDCPYDDSGNIIKRALDSSRFTLFGYQFDIPGRTLYERFAFHPYVQACMKQAVKWIGGVDSTCIKTQLLPFSPAQLAKKIDVPCFFIHCINDELVPVEAGKLVYEGPTNYKRMWITDGRRHFDSYFSYPEKYAFKVNKFIQHVISGEIAHKPREKIIQDLSTVVVAKGY